MTAQKSIKLEQSEDFIVVNIVGTGSLGFEISLDALNEDLPHETWENPGPHPGLHLRFEEDGPLTTFYNSGKFIIRFPYGSEETLYDEYERVITALNDLGIITDENDVEFTISNVVCTGCINRELNLHAVAIGLGLQKVEYEPEQFPALIYRSDDYPCTFLVFANGKVVIPGANNFEEAETAFVKFMEELQEWV